MIQLHESPAVDSIVSQLPCLGTWQSFSHLQYVDSHGAKSWLLEISHTHICCYCICNGGVRYEQAVAINKKLYQVEFDLNISDCL